MRNDNWRFFVLVLFLAFCFSILPRGSANCQIPANFPIFPPIFPAGVRRLGAGPRFPPSL